VKLTLERNLPLVAAFLIGVIIVVAYFVDIPQLTRVSTELRNWAVIITAFTMGIGLVNLSSVHVKRIAAMNRKDWYNSVLLLAAMGTMFVATYYQKSFESLFKYLFDNVYGPLGTAMMSLVMFGMAVTCYRGFKLKNLDGFFIVFGAVATMLGNAPVGAAISKYIPALSDWVYKIPNVAGQRGILISSAVGALAVGLRVLVGLERRHIGLD